MMPAGTTVCMEFEPPAHVSVSFPQALCFLPMSQICARDID